MVSTQDISVNPQQSPVWKELEKLAADMKSVDIDELLSRSGRD